MGGYHTPFESGLYEGTPKGFRHETLLEWPFERVGSANPKKRTDELFSYNLA